MKNSLHTRLLAAFGLMIALIAVAGAAAGLFTWKAQRDFDSLYDGTRGSAELARGNSALWAMRYGISQALNADEAGTRKLAEEDAKWIKIVSDALESYGASDISADEAKALTTLRSTFKRYTEVRPQWFQLRIEGKNDEAKAWRTEHTTPIGASLVKAFNEQIDLQTKAAAQRNSDLHAQAGTVLAVVVGLCVGAVMVAALLAMWITRVLTGPVARATAVADSIASGQLSNNIESDNGPMGDLLKALRNMQASLAATVRAVRSNAESVAVAGTQIAQGNNDLSARTEQQASALQETASSMEQLGSTVRNNADNATQANQLALGASSVAVRGGEVVAKVVDTMKGINHSSSKIADIIGVIDGIAFQTNILALNAAVEAARAGEQGRGFAVVASEVRSLAQRSAEAAKEIKQLITASVEQVEQGTSLVDEAGSTMQEVVAAIRRVTDIMGEISAASAEQSAGVAQVGAAVHRMDQSTQQNAALVEQSAAAAENLKAQAQAMVQAVAVFNLAPDEKRLHY